MSTKRIDIWIALVVVYLFSRPDIPALRLVCRDYTQILSWVGFCSIIDKLNIHYSEKSFKFLALHSTSSINYELLISSTSDMYGVETWSSSSSSLCVSSGGRFVPSKNTFHCWTSLWTLRVVVCCNKFHLEWMCVVCCVWSEERSKEKEFDSNNNNSTTHISSCMCDEDCVKKNRNSLRALLLVRWNFYSILYQRKERVLCVFTLGLHQLLCCQPTIPTISKIRFNKPVWISDRDKCGQMKTIAMEKRLPINAARQCVVCCM